MLVKDAKDIARKWVIDEGSKLPGFYGAFYHGSINWLSDSSILSTTSDVDIMVVLDDSNPSDKLGKFIYQDIILEVSYLPSNQLLLPDQILAQYHLAGDFRVPSVILDPSGRLSNIQTAVAEDYAKRKWVYKRCEHAMDKIMKNLQSLNNLEPFHDQVAAWLFAAGVMCHVLLVAGLKNPTVRRRYLAVKELLEEYGYSNFYEILLEVLGCAKMNRTDVECHLARLVDVFDVAKRMIKTPFFFASDISDIARPIVIDGSKELIEGGYHREAVFWIAATYSRCQKILYHDAPVEVQNRFTPGYLQLLGDLGIASPFDLQQRGEQIKKLLPQLWSIAEVIISANSAVEN
jgi:hypothetical protein